MRAFLLLLVFISGFATQTIIIEFSTRDSVSKIVSNSIKWIEKQNYFTAINGGDFSKLKSELKKTNTLK